MSSPSIASVSKPAGARQWYDSALLRVAALAVTLTAPAAYKVHRLLALSDQDIWWRLRTGLWILQNHAIPRTGLFSQAASRPWIDASWGFDLLVAVAYRAFGLTGLPMLLMLLQVATASAFFLLARVACRSFWPAVILTAIAQCCIVPLQPRPGMCSLIFIAVELACLLEARRTGDTRVLYWLPALFVWWVNFDRQFAYGLMVLLLFCLAAVVEELGRRSPGGWIDAPSNPLRLGALGVIAVASLLATFVSPYVWRLDGLVWQSATSSAADRYFRELHSMRFRQPQDYLLMLLTMTAFFALGRRRSRDLFLLSLLIVSSVISFQLVRDNWLVVVVSVAIIGNALYLGDAGARRRPSAAHEILAVAALSLAVLAAVLLRLPARNNLHQEEELLSRVHESFPLGAANYLRQNHLPQPLFNSYAWGGFLTFALPEYPVSIDGRTDLYGDEYNVEYFRVMQAEVPLNSDPSFAQAQTILLEASSPIAEALSTLPDFRVVYRDPLAVVLVRTR